jgi:hypothetical protein
MIFEVTINGTDYEIKIKGQSGCYESYIDGMLIFDRCLSVSDALDETKRFLKNSGIKEVVK